MNGVDRAQRLVALCWFLAGFVALWTTYAYLLVEYPERLNDPWLRAIVRIGIWVVPTLLLVRFVEGPPVLRHLGLLDRAARGIVVGVAFSVVVLPLLVVLDPVHSISAPKLPATLAVWLNPILTAPLAEELLFRGVVFRWLRDGLGLWAGWALSSLLFAAVHFPYWWLSGSKHGLDLAFSLLSIVWFGVMTAGLFEWTRSLWAPLVFHWLNNLFMASLSR